MDCIRSVSTTGPSTSKTLLGSFDQKAGTIASARDSVDATQQMPRNHYIDPLSFQERRIEIDEEQNCVATVWVAGQLFWSIREIASLTSSSGSPPPGCKTSLSK